MNPAINYSYIKSNTDPSNIELQILYGRDLQVLQSSDPITGSGVGEVGDLTITMGVTIQNYAGNMNLIVLKNGNPAFNQTLPANTDNIITYNDTSDLGDVYTVTASVTN